MMIKWSTDKHASLQSQNISLQPQNILLYRCSIYALNLKLKVLKWRTSYTVTNTFTYNNKNIKLETCNFYSAD